MGKGHRISSIILIVLAIIICIASVRIGLGTFHSPGSGFVPFSAAVLLGLFSVPTLIKASFEKNFKKDLQQEPVHLGKVIKTILALLVYISLLSTLGYLIGTFLLMLFLLKGIENLKWKWAVFTSIFAVLTSYFIFDVLLQCMLPVGFFDLKKVMSWIF